MGETSLSQGLFKAGDNYLALHQIATTPREDLILDTSDGSFAVAVLHHEKSAGHGPEDFCWFKVKGKYTVAKVKKAYERRVSINNITLKLGGKPVADSAQIKDLNCMSDNIIVFTSHSQESQGNMEAMQLTSVPSRVPLQHTGTQLLDHRGGTEGAAGSSYHQTEKTKAFGGSENSPESVVTRTNKEYREEANDAESPFLKNADSPNGWHCVSPVETPSGSTFKVDSETASEDELMIDESSSVVPAPKRPLLNERIQKINSHGTPEDLEAEVAACKEFLEQLKMPMEEFVGQSEDAQHWVQQLDALLKQKVDTPTIIGVVGNTGAGKSSVINAMLDEERLVPTNCMRACTAVVTEMSYNWSNNPNALYRADIEFIQPSDWEKDLRISLNDLIDGSGKVSHDCTNPESEAGVAYAKIKAVYPSWTRDRLANSTVEELMREPEVRKVLGTTRNIEKSKPEFFYKALQSYVDSKEKSTDDQKKKDKKEKGEKKQMEFWPLIKVVRIYTKADALITGAVIVDLPGVHDSNAARAAVAQGYIKQCTGLFIVAPINRAVDDKFAKSLLGDSFKRQLKFDGTYSRITFICSKTDDISIIEASDSLGLEEQMSEDWEKIDDIEKQQRTLKQMIKELRESKSVFSELIDDADNAIDVWDRLKDQMDNGETVYDPSNKRKRSAELKKPRKKAKTNFNDEGDEDDESTDDDNDSEDGENEDEAEAESGSDEVPSLGKPLTKEEIDAKISQFKDDKKRARTQRFEAETKARSLEEEDKALEQKRLEIDTAMSAICIEGRNNYSKGAIQRDFADGIRELDMETAQEEDPDRFNPEDELRDYDQVAKTLPVFCVSSRAYQKLRGRLQRDKDVPGFRSAEETEIPQLKAHCKKLTEAGRASNCRSYLTNLCQLLNSLSLWASNDSNGLNLTDAQLAAETNILQLKLQKLEESLDKAVRDCLKEMEDALAEKIFDKYEQVIQVAIDQANGTVARWGAKVNRDERELGGYFWSTYKAIVRRDGVYANAQGTHDFNAQLIAPLIKNLANHWERVFAQRLPRVLSSFARSAKSLLNRFHKEIETRCLRAGTGSAGIALLGQQLQNYENIFMTLSDQMKLLITEMQREANRQFTPVIARNLASAYQYCTSECGMGQFNRMKARMAEHVDTVRHTMFTESCEEVKGLLLVMCRQVQRSMSEQTDGVFNQIERDYWEVISGSKLPQGHTMPKFERKMRSDVAQMIADREKALLEEQARPLAQKEALEVANETSAVPESDLAGATTANEKSSSPAGRHALPVEISGEKSLETQDATEVNTTEMDLS